MDKKIDEEKATIDFFSTRGSVHKEFSRILNIKQYQSHQEVIIQGHYVTVVILVKHGKVGTPLLPENLTDESTRYSMKAHFNGINIPFRSEVDNKSDVAHINSLDPSDNHQPVISQIPIQDPENIGWVGSVAAGLTLNQNDLGSYVKNHIKWHNLSLGSTV